MPVESKISMKRACNPMDVGVPLKTPAVERLKPAGKDELKVILNVKGAEPPAGVIVRVYGVPAVACGIVPKGGEIAMELTVMELVKDMTWVPAASVPSRLNV